MNILGLLGRYLGIGGNAFSETLLSSIDRANYRFLLPADSALYLTNRTRRGINEKAEWLWQNFGIVKEGVAGIARHTVGKGISLQIDSEDDEWNQLAEDDFEDYALTPERCDLAGRRNFYEAQTTALEQRILRGEFFAAKTENPEWDNEPCFQIYDSEEISTPPSAVSGIETGKIVLDGVELNANSRATFYHLRGLDGLTWTPIPRERMIHWFKPHAVNQVRGISDLAQAVNPLVDIHELKRLATRSAKAQQLIALVLKNVAKTKKRGAMGGIKSAAPSSGDTEAGTDVAQLEQLVGAAGAGIAYLTGDGDAKLLTPNSPSPLVEGFITDLLMRDVCAGWGVPAEFFWSIAKLGGANTRFVLSKADLLFQVLGDGLIYRFCTPIAYRYLKSRIDSGKLRAPSDKNWALKMSWQTPPRVTVDNGRDNMLLIEMLANGMITLREFCNARGMNYRHTMRQWIREPIEFIKIAQAEIKACKDIEPAQASVLLNRWISNMPLWRASKPGTESQNGQTTDPSTANTVTDDPDEEEADDEKGKKAA
jgi:capsid protein